LLALPNEMNLLSGNIATMASAGAGSKDKKQKTKQMVLETKSKKNI